MLGLIVHGGAVRQTVLVTHYLHLTAYLLNFTQCFFSVSLCVMASSPPLV